jgi:hypothetical protein
MGDGVLHTCACSHTVWPEQAAKQGELDSIPCDKCFTCVVLSRPSPHDRVGICGFDCSGFELKFQTPEFSQKLLSQLIATYPTPSPSATGGDGGEGDEEGEGDEGRV